MMTMYPPVPTRRVDADAELPRYAHAGDAAMDLCSMEYVTIAPGETMTVGTGIAMAIPEGFVGLVFPRSGLGSRGLTLSNAVGVIDSGYRGEIRVPLHNNRPVYDRLPDLRVRRGDRVCQIAIVPVATAQLVEVEDLDETERGTNGLGSTGVGGRL